MPGSFDKTLNRNWCKTGHLIKRTALQSRRNTRVLIDDGTPFSTSINNKLDWLISPLSGLCWNNCDYYKMVLYDNWMEISCNIYISRHSGVIVRSKKILGSVPEWGGTFGVDPQDLVPRRCAVAAHCSSEKNGSNARDKFHSALQCITNN